MPTSGPLLPPIIEDGWLRPAAIDASKPGIPEARWGHPEGMQVGLHPSPGPRGLLRVFTPYLDHPRERLVNFVAVEPITRGADDRGYSELEPSSLDPDERGKRMWSTDDGDIAEPRDPAAPARGIAEVVDDVETLTVRIGVERFDDGADVHVVLRFRRDRPHEVELRGFANPASAPLENLVLTATMGNWSRLRVLELADRDVTPAELWPGFEGTDFADRRRFPLSDLRRDGASAQASAIGDEEDPWSVEYSSDTAEHWRFLGQRARQTWIDDDPHPKLVAQVNGRWSYWASASPIPGGPSYENVELFTPFRQGAPVRFRVTPLNVET